VSEPTPAQPAPAAAEPRPPKRRLRTFAIVILLLAVSVLVAGAFLPRWWSQRIADQAGGSFTSGILLGLFYGFVFTLLALGALWLGLRHLGTWKGRAIAVGIALVLAAPNLLTASIVIGWGNAAHAGERTLDVEAPGFRWSTLLGVLAAAVLAVFLGYLVQSRREARTRASALESELGSSSRPTPEP